ncbi:MAG: hypothetical protein M3Q90_03780 [Candidatus Dormibacteraeota bacterium]|nr:hypothetical protein [Candidatus Dormibacteraeota bacterium]
MIRPLRSTIIAIVVILIIVIGIIGYAIAGYAFASTRVAIADKSLNAVITNQNNLNSTFQQIDSQFNSLSSANTFDPKKARILSDQFVTNWKAVGGTVDRDDRALVTARTRLADQAWITMLSQQLLKREVGRIDHARRALSTAKTIAGDYVQDGEFLQAYFDIFVDVEAMQTLADSGDFSGAKMRVDAMKAHVEHALQLSNAPGLPAQVHDLMVDLQVVAADFGKLFEAILSHNRDGITAATATATATADKISAYNFDNINQAIRGFYRPLIDTFNSEMAKATAA